MSKADDTLRWEFKAKQAERVREALAKVNLSLSPARPRTRKPFENDLGPAQEPPPEW